MGTFSTSLSFQLTVNCSFVACRTADGSAIRPIVVVAARFSDPVDFQQHVALQREFVLPARLQQLFDELPVLVGAELDHAVRLRAPASVGEAAVDPLVAAAEVAPAVDLLHVRHFHAVEVAIVGEVAGVEHGLLNPNGVVHLLADGFAAAADGDRLLGEVLSRLGEHFVALREVGSFPGEERRVLGEDAEVLRQSQNLFRQLFEPRVGLRPGDGGGGVGRAELADGVVQHADLPAGPQPADERVAFPRVFKREVEPELARLAEIRSRQSERQRRAAVIPTQHDELVAQEEVGQVGREHFVNAARCDGTVPLDRFEFRLHQHRALKLGEHLADFHLDVLLRQHERRLGAGDARQPREQRRIDVDADAEGVDSPLMRIRLLGERGDSRFRPVSHGRQAVGEEQHDRERVVVVRLT
ncbi:MAG: hypothetical protein WD066_03680 [Planctomycetaceae bacterium]